MLSQVLAFYWTEADQDGSEDMASHFSTANEIL